MEEDNLPLSLLVQPKPRKKSSNERKVVAGADEVKVKATSNPAKRKRTHKKETCPKPPNTPAPESTEEAIPSCYDNKDVDNSNLRMEEEVNKQLPEVGTLHEADIDENKEDNEALEQVEKEARSEETGSQDQEIAMDLLEHLNSFDAKQEEEPAQLSPTKEDDAPEKWQQEETASDQYYKNICANKEPAQKVAARIAAHLKNMPFPMPPPYYDEATITYANKGPKHREQSLSARTPEVFTLLRSKNSYLHWSFNGKTPLCRTKLKSATNYKPANYGTGGMCKKCIQVAIRDFGIPEDEAYAYVRGKSKESVYKEDIHEKNFLPGARLLA